MAPINNLFTYTDEERPAAVDTRIIAVTLLVTDNRMGTIRWKLHGYGFEPEPGAYFNARGLAELELKLRGLMDEWAREHDIAPRDVQMRRAKQRQLNAQSQQPAPVITKPKQKRQSKPKPRRPSPT